MKTLGAVLLAFLFNVAVWLTTGLNVLTGGDGGETFSSRMGKGKLARKPVHTFLSRVIDLVFEILFKQRDHCVQSIQFDEGKNAVSAVLRRVRAGEQTLIKP